MLRFKAMNIYTVASVSVILLMPASFKLKVLYVDKVFFPFSFNMLTGKRYQYIKNKSFMFFNLSHSLSRTANLFWGDICSLIHVYHLKIRRNS
jgi:hypothetical protein